MRRSPLRHCLVRSVLSPQRAPAARWRPRWSGRARSLLLLAALLRRRRGRADLGQDLVEVLFALRLLLGLLGLLGGCLRLLHLLRLVFRLLLLCRPDREFSGAVDDAPLPLGHVRFSAASFRKLGQNCDGHVPQALPCLLHPIAHRIGKLDGSRRRQRQRPHWSDLVQQGNGLVDHRLFLSRSGVCLQKAQCCWNGEVIAEDLLERGCKLLI
mmetsp:Transcript_24417/g.77018  ORF Transcript_24417/g.77018 Transcript_24417/m.77018 type:complete len:212 (+) Transcript_24417:109-744(+)